MKSITITPREVEILEEITQKIDTVACMIGGCDSAVAAIGTPKPSDFYGVLEYPIDELREFVGKLSQRLQEQKGDASES